jgi:large subunit ribosomal protein L9
MQQIILIQDVETLGRRGSLVSVRDGYARNFLLPQQLGVRASRDNLKRLEGLRQKYEVEEKERADRAKALVARLEGVSLTVTMKASEEGHLYGSVTNATLHELLAAQGIELDPRMVRLTAPLKEVGVYSVSIVLHETVRTEIKVWVVAEKDAKDAKDEKAGADERAAATATGDAAPPAAEGAEP